MPLRTIARCLRGINFILRSMDGSRERPSAITEEKLIHPHPSKIAKETAQARFGTAEIEIMPEPRPQWRGVLAGLVWIDFPRVQIENGRRAMDPARMLQ